MAVVRFLPFGRAGGTQPYVGAGLGLLQYRYSEIGRFVDPETLDYFDSSTLNVDDRFKTCSKANWLGPTVCGTAAGSVILGGLRLPLGGDVYGMSLEGRYLMGVGETGGLDAGFLDEKIDLSGFQFNIGFHMRF